MAQEKSKEHQYAQEMVSVDFIEFDEIRTFVKNWIKDYRKKYPRKGGSWITSGFYVGRTTTSCYIREINAPYLVVTRILHAVRAEFPEYKAYRDGNNMRIYLR